MRFSPPINADFIRRSRRIWSPAKINRDFHPRLMRTHLAIFLADCSDVAVSKSRVIKLPTWWVDPPDDSQWWAWKIAGTGTLGEFNRRYLTCQISAILYADRGDRRKSQSLHREHLAIFADRGDRRIKSPGVHLVLIKKEKNFPVFHMKIRIT